MSERKWLLSVGVAAAVGGSALAVGFIPGVRTWINQSFPSLGINGQVSELPSNSETTPLKNIDEIPHGNSKADPIVTEAPEDSLVRFAQATSPVPVPVRFAQNPNIGIPQVPSSGIEVPSATKQPTQSRSGTLLVKDCQITFPKDIMVAAQSEGRITELFVDDGSVIKQGEVMLCLDSRIAEADADVSKQELLGAEIKLKDNSSVRYAEAAVNVAKVELEISDDLNAKGAESDLDNRKKRLELTKADLQVTVSKNEKEQQAAAVALQQAKLKATQVRIDLLKVVAPWDGFVSEVAKKQYSFVRPGEVVFRFTSMESIRVVGNAEVNVAPHTLLNAPARVTILVPGMSDVPVVQGHVSYVAPRSPAINFYPIHVNISNQITADGQYLFREGMLATIEVLVGPR